MRTLAVAHATSPPVALMLKVPILLFLASKQSVLVVNNALMEPSSPKLERVLPAQPVQANAALTEPWAPKLEQVPASHLLWLPNLRPALKTIPPSASTLAGQPQPVLAAPILL